MSRVPRDSEPRRSGSFVPFLLAAILGCACLAILSLLTLGFAGVIFALVLSLAAIIGFQYLVWGWWLGRYIQAEESKRQSSEVGDSGPGDNPPRETTNR